MAWVDLEIETHFMNGGTGERFAQLLTEKNISPGTVVVLTDENGNVSAVGWTDDE